MHPFTSIRRIRRPSPATVIACLALFVALGGTALAAGAIITSNSQVGPQTISGGRDGITLGGKIDNVIDGSITNDDLARKSVSEDKLGPGIVGPRASGRVGHKGTLEQDNGQPVVKLQGLGDYCISVPGRSPVTSSIIVSPDSDTTPSGGPTPAHTVVVEGAGACAGLLNDGHGFRVKTFELRVIGSAVLISPANRRFAFIVN